MRRYLLAVLERNPDHGGILDHVLIGYDNARRIYDEAGTNKKLHSVLVTWRTLRVVRREDLGLPDVDDRAYGMIDHTGDIAAWRWSCGQRRRD